MRKAIWNVLSNWYPFILRTIYRMNIGENVKISYKALLDKSINPEGITIGNNSWILAGSAILAHDHCRGLKTETVIGSNCIIGIRAIILPGVTIGDHVVVGAGSVVTKNIPSHSIVAGNPAKVLKEGNVMVDNKGRIISS